MKTFRSTDSGKARFPSSRGVYVKKMTPESDSGGLAKYKNKMFLNDRLNAPEPRAVNQTLGRRCTKMFPTIPIYDCQSINHIIITWI